MGAHGYKLIAHGPTRPEVVAGRAGIVPGPGGYMRAGGPAGQTAIPSTNAAK